ncbi:MAG TPA: DUF4249 domain-containing protein [Bacteroidales bacterium]|nr:DUF4249 domain-containing protein [Bacteroidales bacterium]HRX97347.1 DUF4249 domain-containing protein [Bacteroidales bacterium]
MTSKFRLILFLVFTVLTACVEEYWPEIEKYDNLLVVDGIMTNARGAIIVKLSRSASLDQSVFIPETEASLSITDNIGNQITLQEKDPGIYLSDSTTQPMAGRSYQLNIQLANGESYESETELLQEPIKISQVTWEEELKPGHELLHDIEGYQFYIDSKEAIKDSSFLMWSLLETYKYKSDFKIQIYYDGEIKPFPRPDSLQTCWKTERVSQLFTGRTDGLNQPVIRHFPLHYVDTETRKLYIRYSLLVNQYTLTESAWNFWEQVKIQSEEQGGLYQTQPYRIVGNIKNINDPDEAVLGQFTVAGTDTMRVFVPRAPLNYYYEKCILSEADIENFSAITEFPPESWPIYATTSPEGAAALPLQECLDCRLKGGTIQEPVFWTNY